MQDLIFATYLIPPFAFIIVTIAGISAKSATSYAQHFRRRVLEQEIKSPHYVGFLHSELFQTAIKASLARETTNSAVFFIQTINSPVPHATHGRQNTSVRRLDYD